MILNRFLEFPSSKGSVKIPTNELIGKYKEDYKAVKSKISAKIYKIGNEYFAHVLIPSGSVDKFFYDVLIQFTSLDKTLEDSHIKIFSNSPSFVYSFAYVFYNLDVDGQKNMIADDMDKLIPKNRLTADITDKKIDDEVLEHAPVTRNPYGLPLFDKTLYFGVFYILEKYDPQKFKRYARVVNNKFLIDNIKSFEKTMLLREKMLIEAKKKEINQVVANKTVKKEAKERLDQGMNVSIRYNKKVRGGVIKSKPSSNIRKIKAASTSINEIKKMK